MSRTVRSQSLLLLGMLAVFLAAASVGRLLATEQAAAPAAPADRPPADELPTAQSAVAAALDLVSVLGSTAMYDDRSRRAVLDRVAAESARAELDRGFRLAADALGLKPEGTAQGGDLVARVTPVGHRLDQFQGETAVVSVWTVGLLGVAGATSAQPVQASWSTETVTLTWLDGRWQWAGLVHAEGPAPVGSAQVPAPPSQLAQQVRDFREPTHAG